MGPSEALHREPVWLGWISDVIPKAAQVNDMSQAQTAPTKLQYRHTEPDPTGLSAASWTSIGVSFMPCECVESISVGLPPAVSS